MEPVSRKTSEIQLHILALRGTLVAAPYKPEWLQTTIDILEQQQREIARLQSIQQERDKLEQQVNTLQEELNIAHYANETLSNQYHKIREHNHMQGQKIQTLQGQVNTLTKFLVDFRERTPYGLYQEQIDTVLLSLESPREEQTK